MSIYSKILNFFDKLEDRVRGHLSKYPIFYSMLGSIFLVLLWRGIWHTADLLEGEGGVLGFIFHPFVSATWATWGLLLIGLFVSMFVGDMIIMSGLRRSKKVTEQTEEEIKQEEQREEYALEHIEKQLNRIEKKIEEDEKYHKNN
ncbi:MAG: hypothetical protein ACR2IQ_00170 [Minisyncoccia bacterium]